MFVLLKTEMECVVIRKQSQADLAVKTFRLAIFLAASDRRRNNTRECLKNRH